MKHIYDDFFSSSIKSEIFGDIALIKLGSRITINSKSVAMGETESVIKILNNCGYKVNCFTSILKSDIKSDYIFDLESNIINIINNHKILVILNGNVNFFGGAEDRLQILNYKVINKFKGNIFYFLIDPKLILKQIWNSIENKIWKDNYSKDDIYITRTDINYVAQLRNISEFKSIIGKIGINIKNIYTFEFEKFPLITMTDEVIDIDNLNYDILYGGTFRNGSREDDMIKYYFDIPEDIKVEFFGNIEVSQFNTSKISNLKPPKFNKFENYCDYNKKMIQSMSTIIIGDKIYKKLDNLAPRIYESIKIGNVLFVDESYDFNKRIFKNKFLSDFCYVNSKTDIIDKTRYLKNNKSEILKTIKLQKEDVYNSFDKNNYYSSLQEILNA